MSRQYGFTRVDLLTVVLIVFVAVLLAGVFWPPNFGLRTNASNMKSSTQLRGIGQGMVVFAQGNNLWYPGLDAHGNGDPTVEDRFQILLDANYFTGEYAINPNDLGKRMTPWRTGPVTNRNYSYAMLQVNPGASFDPAKPPAVGSPYARRKEWRDTLNGDAVILADRNTGTAAAPQSVWTTTPGVPGDWRGSVTRNDNSTSFETTHIAARTVYSGVETLKDHLFEASSDSDALLIHSGTGGP